MGACAIDGVVERSLAAVWPEAAVDAVLVIDVVVRALVFAGKQVRLASVADAPASNDWHRWQIRRTPEGVNFAAGVPHLTAHRVRSVVVVPCAHRGLLCGCFKMRRKGNMKPYRSNGRRRFPKRLLAPSLPFRLEGSTPQSCPYDSAGRSRRHQSSWRCRRYLGCECSSAEPADSEPCPGSRG